MSRENESFLYQNYPSLRPMFLTPTTFTFKKSKKMLKKNLIFLFSSFSPLKFAKFPLSEYNRREKVEKVKKGKRFFYPLILLHSYPFILFYFLLCKPPSLTSIKSSFLKMK